MQHCGQGKDTINTQTGKLHTDIVGTESHLDETWTGFENLLLVRKTPIQSKRPFVDQPRSRLRLRRIGFACSKNRHSFMDVDTWAQLCSLTLYSLVFLTFSENEVTKTLEIVEILLRELPIRRSFESITRQKTVHTPYPSCGL